MKLASFVLFALLAGLTSQPPTPPTPDATGTPAPPTERQPFATWLDGVRAEALTRGVREATVTAAFDGVEPVDKVLERDRTQAEFTLSLEDYLKRRLTTPTVRTARTMAKRHQPVLTRAGKAYGVDPRMLVSVWGLESNFGRFAGVRPTVPVLATLAWEGRRGDFFRQQLFDALTIVDRGDIALDKLKGSWAGALGQVQFMPSSYLAWAVDFDKDGDRDVWTSMPDVFGSIGNYLQQHGWTPGRWGYAVKIPDAAREKVVSVPLRDDGLPRGAHVEPAARAEGLARAWRDARQRQARALVGAGSVAAGHRQSHLPRHVELRGAARLQLRAHVCAQRGAALGADSGDVIWIDYADEVVRGGRLSADYTDFADSLILV